MKHHNYSVGHAYNCGCPTCATYDIPHKKDPPMQMDPNFMAQMMACLQMMQAQGQTALPLAPEVITIAADGVQIVEKTNAKGQKYCVAQVDPNFVDTDDAQQTASNFSAMTPEQKQEVADAIAAQVVIALNAASYGPTSGGITAMDAAADTALAAKVQSLIASGQISVVATGP